MNKINSEDKETLFVIIGIIIGMLVLSFFSSVTSTYKIHNKEISQSLELCLHNDGVNSYKWNRFDNNEVMCNNKAIFKLDKTL